MTKVKAKTVLYSVFTFVNVSYFNISQILYYFTSKYFNLLVFFYL